MNQIETADPYQIPFFFDFMLFLKRLQDKPIKRTQTGAISLSDIQDLTNQFKEQGQLNEYRHFGWRIHRADEFQFLQQIQFIAEVMFLTYKRKGLLLLSKTVKAFYQNWEAFINLGRWFCIIFIALIGVTFSILVKSSEVKI